MIAVKAPAYRESAFNRIADYVSAAIGRQANFMIWLVLVAGWTLLFIGFLVAAAANRSERNLERTLAAIADQEKQIEAAHGHHLTTQKRQKALPASR
jgi:HAMP domain-containing protein